LIRPHIKYKKSTRSNLSYLKIWGSDAYVKCIVSEKLRAKSDKYKFIGYLKEPIGNYSYDLVK
jgi:hypothetical protein